ncbi:MAG: hypothetical protein P8Y44_05120 [Acidobacteriota bacterium]
MFDCSKWWAHNRSDMRNHAAATALGHEDQLETEEVSVKVSVLMPADMVSALKVAGFQRRSLGEPDVGLSGLVREAVNEWLEREIRNSSLITVQIQ